MQECEERLGLSCFVRQRLQGYCCLLLVSFTKYFLPSAFLR